MAAADTSLYRKRVQPQKAPSLKIFSLSYAPNPEHLYGTDRYALSANKGVGYSFTTKVMGWILPMAL